MNYQEIWTQTRNLDSSIQIKPIVVVGGFFLR